MGSAGTKRGGCCEKYRWRDGPPFFFQMRSDYTSRMEPESDAAARLRRTQGILLDEYTLNDVQVWNKIKKICVENPLDEDLRKRNALGFFGYRDVVIVGDNFQLPPASGYAPLVTHRDDQEMFEFFVLQENRRQEKNPL